MRRGQRASASGRGLGIEGRGLRGFDRGLSPLGLEHDCMVVKCLTLKEEIGQMVLNLLVIPKL